MPADPQSAGETWFAKRLSEHGVTILSGAADRETRMERFRSAILGCYLEQAIVGKNAGKPETYSQSFERLYGEPLQRPQRKSEHLGD